MSNSLWPHGLQHTRLPYPSPSPGACSNSCPLSQWRHPAISSSLIPFFSCFLSFPASGSFPMSQFFASGWQNIGVSASASVLPLGWTGLISFRMDWLDLLAVQGTLKNLLQHHSSKASVLRHLAFFIVQLSHPYMTTGHIILQHYSSALLWRDLSSFPHALNIPPGIRDGFWCLWWVVTAWTLHIAVTQPSCVVVCEGQLWRYLGSASIMETSNRSISSVPFLDWGSVSFSLPSVLSSEEMCCSSLSPPTKTG